MAKQIQKFIVTFDAPSPEQSELVTAAELQEFMRTAVDLMIAEGQPQDCDSLYYAGIRKLTVVGA